MGDAPPVGQDVSPPPCSSLTGMEGLGIGVVEHSLPEIVVSNGYRVPVAEMVWVRQHLDRGRAGMIGVNGSDGSPGATGGLLHHRLGTPVRSALNLPINLAPQNPLLMCLLSGNAVADCKGNGLGC